MGNTAVSVGVPGGADGNVAVGGTDVDVTRGGTMIGMGVTVGAANGLHAVLAHAKRMSITKERIFIMSKSQTRLNKSQVAGSTFKLKPAT